MLAYERRGFTLIEMLIVIVIVAILGAIAYGRFNRPTLSTLVEPDSVVAPQAGGRFVVKVTNAFGRPQQGVPVVFRVVEGNATIGPEIVQTDSSGSAAAEWVASRSGGLNAFSASVGTSDWSRSQATVTMRVDPTLGQPVIPPALPADSVAAGRDTAPTPPAATPTDTSRRPPPARPGGGGAPNLEADTAQTRVEWSTAPLWAWRISREVVGLHAED